jgi:hypothetical protein
VEFYENQLTRVLDNEAQLLFFRTSPGSYWHNQLALVMLSRKFHLGPGMATGKSLTPLQIHLELLEDLVKIPKSKFSPKKPSDILMLMVAISTAKFFASKELSTFGDPRASWVTATDITALKEFLEPYLTNASTNWNPFLIPYRVMFGKPIREPSCVQQQQDIEVVILTDSTKTSREPSPKTKSRRIK